MVHTNKPKKIHEVSLVFELELNIHFFITLKIFIITYEKFNIKNRIIDVQEYSS